MYTECWLSTLYYIIILKDKNRKIVEIHLSFSLPKRMIRIYIFVAHALFLLTEDKNQF